MKILKYITLTILICFIFCTPVFADDTVTLTLDGEEVICDVLPVIENDRVLIPARALFEKLGADVKWDSSFGSGRVTITHKKNKIELFINSSTALVNSEENELDAPARIIDSRTFIPVRFVSEKLNYFVDWDGDTRTVIVESPKEDETITKYRLTDITVKESDEKLEIRIKGLSETELTQMKLTNPNRYVFDFADSVLDTTKKNIECDSVFVKAIRCGQFDKETVRIVLDLDKFYLYDVERDDSYIKIIFDNETDGKESEDDEDEEDIGISDDIKANKDALKHYVIIDPGHGGKDVGTIGKNGSKEIYEKDLNIDIAQKVNKLLKAQGIKTYMIREEDETVDIYDRPVIANEEEGTLYLSIHNNASENPDVKGTQIYYSDSQASFENYTNKQIAKIYYDEITKLGLKQAGLVDNPRYIVIYRANMPSFIIENAFVSNEEDLKLLMDKDFRTKLAQAIAKATIKLLNKAE